MAVKCYRTPEQKIAFLKELYNSFEVKDMTFPEFIAEFIGAISPPTPQELMDIQMTKARADSAGIRHSNIILP